MRIFLGLFTNDIYLCLQIAMISPGMSCCEHTLNTLRYADRLVHMIGLGEGGGVFLSYFSGVRPPFWCLLGCLASKGVQQDLLLYLLEY